jgi:restriction endonuclease Mrr
MSREEDKAETWRIISQPQWPNIQILKQQVHAKTRHLAATWTVEVEEEIESHYGVNVEEELQNAIIKEMADEIDQEILKSLKGKFK